jgi:arylamine N-acetyltransferase
MYVEASKMKNISYDVLKDIVKENQKLFPLEGIKYLEEGNVKVMIRSLDDDSGTLIG